MRPHASCLVARAGLAAASLVLAAWKIACVAAGPDVDTDAYAHHMIARAILADPRDLAVHWVWLPLFHYLQVPIVAAGGTMNVVRYANVVLTSALPIVLFAYVRRTAEPVFEPAARSASRLSPCAIASLAALFAAASPIVMQMGTTAQPEPLFALAMLGVAIAFEGRRDFLAAGLLGAGVLLRYEAWAALAAVAATQSLGVLGAARSRRSASAPTVGGAHRQALLTLLSVVVTGRLARGAAGGSGPTRPRMRGRGGWMVVALPLALILIWATLRRPVDGRWFGFLRQTREFATSATHENTALDRGVAGLIHDALYYPVLVPARIMGPVLLLAPFGVARTLRQQGARFVLVLSACLGFVSLTWIMRSSLGLDRHFVVVVPLYATFAAQGAAALVDGVEALTRRGASAKIASATARAFGAALSLSALTALALALRTWMTQWKGSIERGWPDRAAVGAYLRALPPSAEIFCDEATVEILSGLDRTRFDRHWMDDDHTWELIEQAARVEGSAYVATWSRKLAGHEGVGRVVFRSSGLETGPDPQAGLIVLQVVQDAGRAAR